MDLKQWGSPISSKDGEKLLVHINTLLRNDNKHKFPGYQPVSLMRSNVQDLICENYLVCEKTDGIRALLYICTINNTAFGFFLDRKNIFYRLGTPFPLIEDTLFDGEAVVDTEGTMRYLICDAMLFRSKNITGLNLIERLGYALRFIKLYTSESMLKISVKEMQKAYGLHAVYMQQNKLKHRSDGLIFTPTNMPYRSGTAPKLLKWKPPHLNSVDFVVKRSTEWERLYKLFCLNSDKKLVHFDYYFDLDDDDAEKDNYVDLDDTLCEFRFNAEKWVYDLSDLSLTKGGWELIKARTDKDMPNSISVVINVMNSINEDIAIEDLMAYIPEIRRMWKVREAQQ
jgi:mRNA guanylyltransferase